MCNRMLQVYVTVARILKFHLFPWKEWTDGWRDSAHVWNGQFTEGITSLPIPIVDKTWYIDYT